MYQREDEGGGMHERKAKEVKGERRGGAEGREEGGGCIKEGREEGGVHEEERDGGKMRSVKEKRKEKQRRKKWTL